MKSGQFFIIGLVLLAIGISVAIGYFISIGRTSTVVFISPTSDWAIKNIENAIKEENERINLLNWWNISWNYRKQINISSITSNPIEINPNIPSDKITNCTKEIRVINESGEINSDVSSDVPPCNIIFNASVGEYYIYYNNSLAEAPSYRNIGSGDSSVSYTLGDEEFVGANLCTHFKKIYLEKFVNISCSRTILDNNFKYTLYIKADDFEFNGSIS